MIRETSDRRRHTSWKSKSTVEASRTRPSGLSIFEKTVKVSEVFNKDEMIDTISITRGKGTQVVIKRFGVTRLPRKTHRGLRKIACIGAWHPSAVKWTVGRV